VEWLWSAGDHSILSATAGAITLPLWKAGFVIEEMAESLPTEECKKRYPEKYQQLRQEPLFLCVRAQKG
jgi:hypothetical protein